MKNERLVVACVLGLFLGRAVLASAIIPPWQGPDEPAHLSAARWLSLPAEVIGSAPVTPLLDTTLMDSARLDVQRQMLESLVRYQWFETRGMLVPQPIPRFFHEVQNGRALAIASLEQPLYYGLAASVLRVTGRADIDGAYWRLRTLSVALSVMVLVIGWAGTRLLFGPAIAAGALAIGALHPQFLITAVSVNPDALVNVCGASVWWLCACVIAGKRRAMSLILLVVAAGAAVLLKRSALPLAALALIAAASLPILLVWRTRRPRQLAVVGVLVAGAGAALIAVVALGAAPRLVAIWNSAFVLRRTGGGMTVSALLEYLRITVDYSWLVAGWQRYPASDEWLWVARALTVICAAGALVALVRGPELVRRGVLLAWVFVGVQAVAIVGPGFSSLAAPQGRFLFAMFAPLTLLLWIGSTHLVPRPWRVYAGPVLLGVLAVMDVTGFTTVLLPAYVPSVLYVR